MRYTFFLWDFDGTLADTFACTVRIYNGLAASYGLPPIDDPQAARGLSMRTFIRTHRIGFFKLASLTRAVLAGQRAEAARLPLFPGLAEVLQGVRRAGCRMAIVSSNAEDNIRACLRAGGVEGLFEAVVGYSRLFGKGRAIGRFLRACGVGVREVVYVGDEVRDVEAARKARVAAAAVAWGYQARTLLAEQAPDHLLDEPGQLLALLG
jgi:phosphoglycolate phosphatase